MRAPHVGDRQHRRSALACLAHRGERVGGLAGLGDADYEVAWADDGVAVAVLGGHVDLDRYPCPLLDRVATDQPGVVGGAAGDHHDPLYPGEDGLVEGSLLGEIDAVPARGAIGDGVRHGIRLFVDLLEHEGVIAALLGGLFVPLDALHRALHGLAGGGRDGDARRPQLDDLAVLHVLHLARLGEEGGHRGGHELLALAAPDD